MATDQGTEQTGKWMHDSVRVMMEQLHRPGPQASAMSHFPKSRALSSTSALALT